MQNGLLRGAEPASQAPLELMLQRLEAPLDGLIGSLRDQPQPAAEYLGVDPPLLLGLGRDVQVFVQLGSHREQL